MQTFFKRWKKSRNAQNAEVASGANVYLAALHHVPEPSVDAAASLQNFQVVGLQSPPDEFPINEESEGYVLQKSNGTAAVNNIHATEINNSTNSTLLSDNFLTKDVSICLSQMVFADVDKLETKSNERFDLLKQAILEEQSSTRFESSRGGRKSRSGDSSAREPKVGITESANSGVTTSTTYANTNSIKRTTSWNALQSLVSKPKGLFTASSRLDSSITNNTLEWKKDARHGQGAFYLSNGDRYVGEYVDDKRHGHGIMIHIDGESYVGDWVDDSKHNEGIQTWSDGSKYIGEWKMGFRSGEGTFTDAQGKKYFGHWKNDKKNGWGTLMISQGRKYIGEFMDDKRHGEGINTYVSGKKYVGRWENDKKHGPDTVILEDGWIYTGEWNEGKQYMKGSIVSDSKKSCELWNVLDKKYIPEHNHKHNELD